MSDILVIGGGVSGLSAGIYGLLNGHKVTVCEKYVLPGGNLTAWNRRGYHIDTCIHWLTGTNRKIPMYTMWKQLGALDDDTEIIKPDVLFTVDHNGQQVHMYRDLDRTISEMLEISPEDRKEIMSFKKAVLAIHGYLGTFGPEHDRKLTWGELLKYMPSVLRYLNHSTGEIASKFKNETLGLFFDSIIGKDFGAFCFAFIMATFTGDNADIPRGMSSSMAERMTARFKELGGVLLTNKEAVRVNVESGRAKSVTFKDGSEISADYVILALEPGLVFGKLLDMEMPKDHQKLNKDLNFKRFSSYHIEYSCDSTELPFAENIFLEVPEKYKEIIGNRRIILREFSHEPSFTQEGKLNLQVMVYCTQKEIDEFLNLYDTDREKYKEIKQKKAEAVTAVIEERYPEYKGKLTVLDVWTPASFRRYTGAEYGTYQSFIIPKRYIPHRLDMRVKGVENILLASQWQMSPGGLPVAASSGRAAIKEIDGYVK